MRTSNLCAVMLSGVTQCRPSMLSASNLPSSRPSASHVTSASTDRYCFSRFFRESCMAARMMLAVWQRRAGREQCYVGNTEAIEAAMANAGHGSPPLHTIWLLHCGPYNPICRGATLVGAQSHTLARYITSTGCIRIDGTRAGLSVLSSGWYIGALLEATSKIMLATFITYHIFGWRCCHFSAQGCNAAAAATAPMLMLLCIGCIQ